MDKRGFTLIEAMVAIAIIALAIVGPMYTANSSIVAAELANDQLTASYLAQEGIEYVRTMRDDAYLNAYATGTGNASQDGWNSFVSGNGTYSIKQCGLSSSAKECTLDPILSPMCVGNNNCSLTPCNGNGNVCGPLYLTSTHIYTTQSNSNGNGNTATPFTRTIQASPISSTEVSITSTVEWSFRGSIYSEVVTDNLTAWQ